MHNSAYISWLTDQSYSLSNSYNLMHFSFIAANDIVDVIVNYHPEIKIIL